MNVLYDALVSKSRRNRDGIAVTTPTKSITFLELREQVDSVAQTLIEKGVGDGQPVQIELPGYLDWVVSLALFKVGAFGVSVPKLWPDNKPETKFRWSVVLPGSDSATANTSNEEVLVMDPSWLSRANTSNLPSHSFKASDLVRGFPTSGSTGHPRIAALSHGALMARFAGLEGNWCEDVSEFNLMPLGSVGGFSTAMSSLVGEFPYFAADTPAGIPPNFFEVNTIRCLTGSPQQIGFVLGSLSPSDKRLSSVKRVKLAGSNPGSKLISQIRSRLTDDIVSVYGSTETAGVFSKRVQDDDSELSLGVMRKDCSYKVADSSGNEVGIGETGDLLLKSPFMYEGYLKDIIQMQVSEQSEWFNTGDSVVRGNSSVEFVGRLSDVLNVGGVKLFASVIEEFSKSLPGITDAVSFAGEDKNGSPIHVLAICSDKSFEISDFKREINQKLGPDAPSLIWQLPELPKAELDKPARWLLAEMLKQTYPR